MAVLFDALGPSSAGAGTSGSTQATSASWSHTCSGTDRAVVVGVVVGSNGNDDLRIASVTYDGSAMTSLGKVHSNNQTAGYVELFGLLNPPTGAKSVAVTLAPNSGTISAGSISVTGAGSFGTAWGAYGPSGGPTITLTGTTSGNLIVDVAGTGAGFTGSGQTGRWLKNTNTDSAAGNGAQSTAAAGGSVTMSYTDISDWWAIAAVEIVAALVSKAVRGSAAAGLAATAQTKKVARVSGVCSMGLSGAAGGRKAAPQAGRSVLGFAGSGRSAKVVAQRGTAAAGLAGAAVARKVAPSAGGTAFGLAGTADARKLAVTSGAATLGVVAVSQSVKVAATRGVSALGLAATRSGLLVRAVAGIASMGLSAGARPVKVAIGRGSVALGIAAQAPARKVAVTRGTAAVGLAATRSGLLARAVAGICGIGLAGAASVRKVAVSGGTSAAGVAASVLPRKRVSTLGRAALALAGSAGARKVSAAGGRAVLVVGGQVVFVPPATYGEMHAAPRQTANMHAGGATPRGTDMRAAERPVASMTKG